MSSILKALKKLEDDKASRRPDELKIDEEILRSSATPGFSATKVIVASLLLLAGGSCLTYMFMKPDMVLKHSSLIKSPDIPSQNRPAAPVSSVIKAESLPLAAEVMPANSQKKAETPRQHQTLIPDRTKSVLAAPKPSKQVLSSKPLGQANTPKSESSAPLAVSEKVVPVLRVNGIAFNDKGVESVAMINGVPVSSGALIDGAKIEEIHKNRVKFSYNGETFEIPLGQSNR